MRPIYDLASYFTAQIFTAEAEAGRVYEALVGLVTDNRDPQRLGRVKLKLPVLSEQDTTDWAPIVMLGAGKNRGWFFIPEVDDEVLVLFEHGDVNRPIVVGALWNGKDKPPDTNPGGNPRRVIKSRAGSKIVLDDENDKLVVEDGPAKGRITLDAKANKIVIEALAGDVCLQAPQGDLQIVCQTAELTAKQSIELHSGTTMRWGADAAVTIKAGAISLSGQQANLDGGHAQAPTAPTANPQDVPDPYEARGTYEAGEQTAAAPTSRTTATSATPVGGAAAAPLGEGAKDLPPLEPQPVLVAARWAQARAPVSTAVKLTALCTEMSGKPATFTIRDADDDSSVLATVSATCGDDGVEASWTTPASGPPGRFVFDVAADGKQAGSDVLTLTNLVEVKLVLDDEPADGVRVRLRVEPSREELTAEADPTGTVRFEDAPFGDYTLLLDDEDS